MCVRARAKRHTRAHAATTKHNVHYNLQSSSPLAKARQHMQPLAYANHLTLSLLSASNGRAALVAMMIKAGANPKYKATDGWTAAHAAAKCEFR